MSKEPAERAAVSMGTLTPLIPDASLPNADGIANLTLFFCFVKGFVPPWA